MRTCPTLTYASSTRFSVYNYLEISLPIEISTLHSLMEEAGRFASTSFEKFEDDSPTSHGHPTAETLLLSVSRL